MTDKKTKSIKYKGKGQADRLVSQHEKSGGADGIFGTEAKKHDGSINDVADRVLKEVTEKYKHLKFRKRPAIPKKEINEKLQSLHEKLGITLFVKNSRIMPDGGVVEVKDIHDKWRIILVGESKHQGNDIEKINAGIKQGKNKDQDLMVAGNAIERAHKNILEIRNMMLDESHFPYVVFLQGTNFATETMTVKNQEGRDIQIRHDVGSLNRIDRVTASNFSMKINTNHCKNIEVNGRILQSASLYFQCASWQADAMYKIMLEIAETSLLVLCKHIPKPGST
jgi:type II restriction enzyme